MATKIRAGTSGYSYKGWQGNFYPANLAQAQWLSYYAGKLPTVEINNTFYRMPKTHVVEAWRDAVPADFRFVIKASRRITHFSRLRDAGETTEYLVKRAEVLGTKLGAVLFQLPPNLKRDDERLKTFMALLPADFPAAFEFRHESWLEPGVDDILLDHGHARVISHDDASPRRQKLLLPKADLLYVRLRATKYTPAALAKWHNAISTGGAKQAYVFFKHEDAGVGPKLAAKFLDQAKTHRKPAGPKAAGRKSPTARKRQV